MPIVKESQKEARFGFGTKRRNEATLRPFERQCQGAR
jgi:hypothetical protein